MDCIRKNWRLLLLGLLLAAATLGVFWPVVHHEFINYDDPAYITLNPHIATGLTGPNVAWAFTGYYTGNWHPLTWISHMVDVQLFGLSPTGPHVENLLLHTFNSLLLLGLLHRLTGSVWRSALVGALFALHPLHVESVAWAAERKDLLSTFFFLLTLLAYAGYVASREDRRGKMEGAQAPSSKLQATSAKLTATRPVRTSHFAVWYGLSLGLFALGLMSKPMVVTLPCVLLLLDYWPLGRLGGANGKWQMADGQGQMAQSEPKIANLKSKIPKLLLEKLPFFALSLGSCLVTLVVQDKGGAVASIDRLSLGDRLGNATVAYAAYLRQLFWPVHLSVFYPLPVALSTTTVWLCGALLVALTVAAFLAARRYPAGVVGWLWYLGMLVPVIGLVQVGMQAHADRYTYLPSIGIFILIAWGLGSLRFQASCAKLQGSATPQAARSASAPYPAAWVLGAGAAAVTVALAVATHRQVGYWQSSRTLFQHATQLASDNFVAWQCLGIADLEREDAASALTNFYRGLECAKGYGTEDGNKYFIGAALQLQGKGIEAIPYLEQARVMPEQETERNYRLGLSLTAANRLPEAEAALKRALEAKPQVPEFQLGMAALLMAEGQTNNAGLMFHQIAASFPTNAQAHKSLADFLALNHHDAEAEPEYGAAVARKPNDARLRRAYATALTRGGKIPEATTQLETALKLEPNNAQAHFDYAELLSAQGRDREAVTHYDAALAVEPKHASALNNLAWLLATEPDAQLRNGARAVELASNACQLTEWKQPFLIGTLAAAYAEAGRFPDAVATAEKARDLARTNKLEEVAKRNEELLALYRAGKPYRDGK